MSVRTGDVLCCVMSLEDFVQPGNIRIGAGAKGHCFSRKLRIAQLRILTISRHVIAVSAQQRDNEKGERCIRRRSGSAAGQFSRFFCRFLPRRL